MTENVVTITRKTVVEITVDDTGSMSDYAEGMIAAGMAYMTDMNTAVPLRWADVEFLDQRSDGGRVTFRWEVPE